MAPDEPLSVAVARLEERLTTTTRAVEVLRADMNGRFDDIKTTAEKSAQIRVQRWSLVLGMFGALSAISGISMTILKVLGH